MNKDDFVYEGHGVYRTSDGRFEVRRPTRWRRMNYYMITDHCRASNNGKPGHVMDCRPQSLLEVIGEIEKVLAAEKA